MQRRHVARGLEPEDLRVERQLGVPRIDDRLRLAEPVPLALVQAVRVRDVLGPQGGHDQLGLRRRHDLVLDALQDQHRGRQQVGEVDRAPRAVGLLGLGPRPDHRVLVPALELVRVALGERHEVGDPEVRGARREHIGERQRADHDVAAGAAAANEEPLAVDVAPVDQEPRGVHAVLQVDDAPLAVQPLPVGTPVARRAAVVHVHHGEPAGRPVLQLPDRTRARCCSSGRRARSRSAAADRPSGPSASGFAGG